jgi:hypothetical protein
MPRKRARKPPRKRLVAPRQVTVSRTASSEDLLAACQRAVSRVLEELPAWDRQVLEEHRARVVEVTHRDTRAALEEIRGVLGRVA